MRKYEGIKRDGTKGFARTHCETEHESIANMIKEFDDHLDDCVQSHASIEELADDLQAFLDQAEVAERR